LDALSLSLRRSHLVPNNSPNQVNSPNFPHQGNLLSPKARLLQHSVGVLKWLESPEGRLFSEWIQDMRLREYRHLMESKDTAEIFRSQGAVGILDVIKNIAQDLKEYQRDVLAGRVQPIREEQSSGNVV
jgi:hypothetical protein